ncbi:MAG: hypothetical protein ACJ8GW_10655 [Massilia sp.]
MNMLRKLLMTLFLLIPAIGFAETVTTTIGTLLVPDGLAVLDRDEKPDKAGKPGGLIVFSKANDLPRAVYIVTWNYAEPDGKPFDAMDAVVKLGNPYDKTLGAKDAKAVKVGGVDGARYEGILPTGMRAISYVAANGPYRFIVLLKGPKQSPYKELTDEFDRAIEKFVWKLPEAVAN